MKRNVRKFLFLFSLIAVVLMMSACGGADNVTSNDSEKNGSEGAKKENNIEAPKDDKIYTIKMASPSNPEDTMVKAFYKFKDVVEDESEGRIEVEVIHSGQLGGHADYIDGLQLGSIQAAEINTAVLSSLDDRMLIFDMPYLSKDMDHQKAVIEGGIGNKLSEILEEKADIKIIGWLQRSSRNVYSSKGPIETADDFKGLNIRVMESPVMLKTMELLGARAVPISASERYMALQTGVVDAAENSIALILTEKEYEVTDYVSMTDHFMTPNVIAMDNNFFKDLPSDLQKIVLKAGGIAGEYAFEEEQSQIATAVKDLEAVGMKVNFIEDKSTFIEAVQPIYEEYTEIIGQEFFDAFITDK